MAVINRIRRYSWVAVALIGFAIVAFILADLLGPRGLGFLGASDNIIGTINGEKISLKEFQDELAMVEDQYRLAGQNIDDNTRMGMREQVWNTFIFKKVYQAEFDKLGISVSDKELEQMVQGDSVFIHPFVRQQFSNPQTKKFDKSLLINYLQNISKAPATEQYRWKMFEDAIKQNRLQSKYEALLTNSAYITKAEAERFYYDQNTKADVKFLHVPFTAIPDSTLAKQVTQADMLEYLRKHQDRYKAQETRSLEYVVFDIKPSKKDSTAFYEEIKGLARDLARAENDSLFVQNNADTPAPMQFMALNQIPAVLFDKNPVILKGGVYGPYVDGKAYKIFKVTDEKTDSNYVARAAHILFRADKNMPAEDRDKARKQAQDVLKEIQGGADFGDMARKYGSDGTKDRGGDLGFFGKGQMVKPFEEAVFSRNDIGVIPTLVETDFGYHLISITYPKTNKQFKLAIIDKVLEPSQETRDMVYRQASELQSAVKTVEELRAALKKRPDLVLLKAERQPTNATSLGSVQNAREVMLWAFKDDTKVGALADEIFSIQEENKYLLVGVTAQTTKDASTVEAFQDDLKREIIKERKAAQILKKLDAKAPNLEDMAKKYGASAVVNTAQGLTLNSPSFQSMGFNPLAVGKTFGLAKGKRSVPFADETGVFVLELSSLMPAGKIADFSQQRNELLSQLKPRAQYMSNEALKEFAKIEDRRYKFF